MDINRYHLKISMFRVPDCLPPEMEEMYEGEFWFLAVFTDDGEKGWFQLRDVYQVTVTDQIRVFGASATFTGYTLDILMQDVASWVSDGPYEPFTQIWQTVR